MIRKIKHGRSDAFVKSPVCNEARFETGHGVSERCLNIFGAAGEIPDSDLVDLAFKIGSAAHIRGVAKSKCQHFGDAGFRRSSAITARSADRGYTIEYAVEREGAFVIAENNVVPLSKSNLSNSHRVQIEDANDDVPGRQHCNE